MPHTDQTDAGRLANALEAVVHHHITRTKLCLIHCDWQGAIEPLARALAAVVRLADLDLAESPAGRIARAAADGPPALPPAARRQTADRDGSAEMAHRHAEAVADLAEARDGSGAEALSPQPSAVSDGRKEDT